MMRNLWIVLLVLVLGVNRTAADYSGKDAVEVLTPKNFQQKVLQSSDYWLVEFYAPWCGHCKQLEPEWKSAAKKLQNKVRLGAVNADEHKDLAQQYGIKGFPTIKEFGSDKKKPIDYQGGRTAADIIKYVESNPKIKNMVSSSAITVLTYKNVFTFLSMGEEQRSRRIPSILLFGKSKKKKSTPPTWLKSIAGKLQKTETKKARASVGFIPGSEAKIAKQFKLSQNHLPAIVFVNVAKQTYIVESPKKLNQKFAEDFIKKNLRGKTSEDKFMALPNFPGPDVPKKKPGYKYKKLGPSEAANCFILKKDKKTKKKMCVILVSQNCNKADAIYNLKENDAGNLKSLAKHYRRDPFRFYWLCEKDPLYTLLNDKIFENKLLSNGNSNEVIALKTGKNPRFSVLNELKSIDGGKAYLDLILEGSVRFTRITAALPDFSKVDGIKNEKVKEDNHIEL